MNTNCLFLLAIAIFVWLVHQRQMENFQNIAILFGYDTNVPSLIDSHDGNFSYHDYRLRQGLANVPGCISTIKR